MRKRAGETERTEAALSALLLYRRGHGLMVICHIRMTPIFLWMAWVISPWVSQHLGLRGAGLRGQRCPLHVRRICRGYSDLVHQICSR